MVIEGELAVVFAFLASSDWIIFTSCIVCAFIGYITVQHFFQNEEDEDENRSEKESGSVKSQRQQQQPNIAAEFSVSPPSIPERAVCLGPQVENRRATLKKFDDELKMVLVLRRDLKPSEMVAASWGATAALELVQHVRAKSAEPAISWLRAWNRIGVAKIATRVESNAAMLEVITAALQKNLPIVGIVENISSTSSAADTAKQPAAAAAAAASGKKTQSQQAQVAVVKKLGGGDIMIGEELLKTRDGCEPVCVAIGPAPIDAFEDVTDELKLYH